MGFLFGEKQRKIFMVKKQILIIILAILTSSGFLEAGKIDPLINRMFDTNGVPSRAMSFSTSSKVVMDGTEPVIDVLIKTTNENSDISSIKGIKVKSKIKNVIVASVPLSSINDLAALLNVEYIEATRKVDLNLDVSLSSASITPIKSGYNYKGAGVLVGVVDSGIDFTSNDFRNVDGTSRIKSIWDQTASPSGTFVNPSGFTYGAEYSQSAINTSLLGGINVPEKDTVGHGTHVAGTAAGNGLATGNGKPAGTYVGAASESDILFVKTTMYTSDIIDGVNYIMTKAAALSMPAVVNLSLGTQDSPHDGTSVFETALDNLTGAGKIVVVSAGNDGNKKIHFSGTASASTSSVTVSLKQSSYAYFTMWYKGGNNISIQVRTKSGAIYPASPIQAGGTYLTNTSEGRIIIDATANPSALNNDNNVAITIDNGGGPSVATGQWAIIVKGESIPNGGAFDIWAFNYQYCDFLIYDNDKTLGTPGTGKKIISVGSNTTKTNWTDINGNGWMVTGENLGSASSFSSLGPTRDGRMKPDITAPGQEIGSTFSKDFSGYSSTYVLPDGKHYIMQGTSMASPHVTGLVALLLQKNRNLGVDDIKTALTSTASLGVWNKKDGYGKISGIGAFQSFAGLPPAVPVINTVMSPTNVTTQLLSGTKATDASVIKINGSTTGVTIPTTTTWQKLVNLVEGVNNFSVVAESSLGDASAAATTTITLDTIPPAVPVINAITSPTNITTQILSGTKATDASVIKVNGSTTGVTIPTTTTWEKTVNLVEGVNSFSVTAEDALGNASTSATTAITLDTIPPAVPVINAVTSPTKVTTQLLSGTKAVDASVIKVNGSTTGVTIPTTTTWQKTLNLSEGLNPFSVTAEDAVGNASTAATTAITLDTIPPAVPVINAVTSPTNITTQLLSGTKAVDASVIKVNGSTTGVTIPTTTTWQKTVNLVEGANPFSVTAEDAVGNASTAATTAITLDTIPPAIPVINTVTSPTNITTQLLSGTKATDASVIKINGSTTGVTIPTTTTWQKTVNLSEGLNSFSVTAEDAIGNASTAATTAITLDTIPPTVPVINTVTSPTNITTQLLSGTKATDATVIKVNGSTTGVTIPTTTTWQKTVTLSEGVNSFSVTAEDAVGNASTAATTAITLDTIGPTGNISINNGANYTSTSTVTLTLSAADTTGVSEMKFSNDNVSYGTAEAYAATKVWTITGIDGLKTVYVKYKDTLGNWTTVGIADTITLDSTAPIGTPSTPTDAGVYSSSTTITINWTNGTAADTESGIEGYYLQVGTTPGGQDKFDGDVGNVLTYNVTGCANGSTYYAKVKAKNGAGLYGSYSGNSDGITINDITPPTGSPSTPTAAATYSSNITITINWTLGTSADAESGIAGYYLQVGTTAGGNDKFDGDVGNVLTYNITGCVQGTTYYAKVKAKNGVGLYGAYSGNSAEILIANTIDNTKDNNLTFPLTGAGLTLNISIPAGAFGENLTLTATTLSTLPDSGQKNLLETSIGVEITLSDPSKTSTKNITLIFSYNHTDITGFDENKLVIGYYDETLGRWVVLNTTRDIAGNILVAVTTHFSKYAILQLVPAANLSNVVVFPNPFKSGSGGKYDALGITFGGLTAGAKIKIFSISGGMVKELEETDNDGVLLWDTKNSSGENVASGVYFYLITDPASNKKTGKFAVVR